MEGLGCKPVEAEVGVADGWIADLFGLWYPTNTELKKARAIHRWTGEDDPEARYRAAERLWSRYMLPLTVLVEVKVTKSDLARDIGRKIPNQKRATSLPPAAQICIVAAPGSVLERFDKARYTQMSSWGMLRLSEDGERVVSGKEAMPWEMNAQHPYERERAVMGLIETLDHRTRHARIRQWNKAYRAGRAERAKARSASGYVISDS